MTIEEFKNKYEQMKDSNIYKNYCSVLENKDLILRKTLKENQKLKEQLEASEKARKEAIKYCNVVIKNVENLALKIYPKEFYDLLSILDIDKGEMKDE